VSFEAIRWALAQPVTKSSAKFVLVAMADCVHADDGPDMVCWPSYRALATRTSQDVKTVEVSVHRLRDWGFIADTGERKGDTGQVVVYRLNNTNSGVVTPILQPAAPPPAAPLPTAAPFIKTSESGGVDTAGKTPVFPSKTPVFPAKGPQIPGERTPKTGYGSRNGTSNGTRKEPKEEATPNELPGVPAQLLADYLKVRKAKRAGPLTETAIAGLTREAIKAGISLSEAVRACCEFGWQGFNAGWYAERVAKGQRRSQEGAETAYQRSKREAVERLTGGLASRKPVTTEAPNAIQASATTVIG
jgi:hypothetical protein